jgi:hypothetical protein
MSSEKKKEFKLQAQRYLLTYKTHVDKEDFTEWIKGLWDRPKCVVHIAHENGTGKEEDEDQMYEHSHVCVDFGKALCVRNCRAFDYEGIHPNISPLKSKASWERACNYISKEDPDCAHLKSEDFVSMVNTISDCENQLQAIKKCGGMRNVIAAKAIFEASRAIEIDPELPFKHEFHPWQEKMLKRLARREDRRVNWVYDEVGNSGKTVFSRWLEDRGEAVRITQMGGGRDFATVVQSILKHGGKLKNVILDLSRASESKSIYDPIEQLKSGCLTAIKYEGGNVKLPGIPNVWVMANFLPDVRQLSRDRWKIWEMSGHSKVHRGRLSGTPCNITGVPVWEVEARREEIDIEQEALRCVRDERRRLKLLEAINRLELEQEEDDIEYADEKEPWLRDSEKERLDDFDWAPPGTTEVDLDV